MLYENDYSMVNVIDAGDCPLDVVVYRTKHVQAAAHAFSKRYGSMYGVSFMLIWPDALHPIWRLPIGLNLLLISMVAYANFTGMHSIDRKVLADCGGAVQWINVLLFVMYSIVGLSLSPRSASCSADMGEFHGEQYYRVWYLCSSIRGCRWHSTDHQASSIRRYAPEATQTTTINKKKISTFR